MNRLPSVIGPAPSELSYLAFKEKLSVEHERVRQSLAKFRLRNLGKGKKAKKKKATGLAANLKSAGLSQAEFLKGLELLRQSEATKEKGAIK